MSRLLAEETELLQQRDRELTLGTGAILAIFLGLVLLCGAFFGFGYNLGRKSTTAPLPAATASDPEAASSSTNFDTFKTSPGAPLPAPASAAPPASTAATAATVSNTSDGLPAVTVPAVSSAPSEPAAAPAATTPKPAQPAATTTTPAHETPAPKPSTPPPAATTKPATPPPAPPATPPAAASNGPFVVQVAAVSHKDDADLLVGALHAKGYDVAARTELQDKLLHIQIGPFTSRKDAEAMRQRLIADGYNAIVK